VFRPYAVGRFADDGSDLELKVELGAAVFAIDRIAESPKRRTRTHEDIRQYALRLRWIALTGNAARSLEVVVGLKNVPRFWHRRREFDGVDGEPTLFPGWLEIEPA
jgi:hypothetical protein